MLDSSTMTAIRERLGPGGWRRPEDMPGLFEDPRGRFHGRAALVALPADTAQVAAVMRLCHAGGVPVIAHGGGTGVVAGQLSLDDDGVVILSLARMNALRSWSPDDGALTVEAGCILQSVHEMAQARGMTFPLSMGSKGSCTIGGNLATNAGGINVLRDGNARDLCLGVEAVLADGRILDELTPLHKNNIGYDLRHLLIGSEGTLGIITAATLRLRPLDAETVTAFCAIPDPGAALALLGLLRAEFGNALSALELMSGFGLELALDTLPALRRPLADRHPWYLLAEIGGPPGLRPRLESLLAAQIEAGRIRDAIIADSLAQREAIWALREQTPEVNHRNGAICSSDTSVPISRIPDFVARVHGVVAELHPGLRVNSYGHVGDGNIHHNIFPPAGMAKAAFLAAHPGINDRVRMAITQVSRDLGGSISAEHGIGRLKLSDMDRHAAPVRLDMMRAIKAALDPRGILNPGALLPAPKCKEDP